MVTGHQQWRLRCLCHMFVCLFLLVNAPETQKILIFQQLRPLQPWLPTRVRCTAAFPGCIWWRHQMETFSALLTFCAGNSPVTDEFPAQRPETQSFDVFFDLRLNKRLNKYRDAGDLRRYRAHYNVAVMSTVRRVVTGGTGSCRYYNLLFGQPVMTTKLESLQPKVPPVSKAGNNSRVSMFWLMITTRLNRYGSIDAN